MQYSYTTMVHKDTFRIVKALVPESVSNATQIAIDDVASEIPSLETLSMVQLFGLIMICIGVMIVVVMFIKCVRSMLVHTAHQH